MIDIGVAMFLEYRISDIFLMIFVCLFTKMKMNRFLTGVALALGFIVSTILDDFLFLMPILTGKILIVFLLKVIVIQGTVFLISAYRDGRTLFVGFTAVVYTLLGNVACEAVFFGLKTYFILGLAAQVVTDIVVLLFMCIFVRKIFVKEINRGENIREWLLFSIFPGLGYLAVMSLAVWPVSVERTPEAAVSEVIVIAVIYSTYAVIARSFQTRQRSEALRHSNDILEMYSRHLKQEADEMEKKNREVAIIRHDIKHDYGMILSFLEEEEYDKIEELIKKKVSDLEKTKLRQYCSNRTVDGILSRWKRQADRYNVGFEVTADIGKVFNDTEFEYEFAATLSNLLENAIDATSVVTDRERVVQVVVRCTDKKVGVVITNPYLDGTVNRDLETTRLISAKGEGHGYGTQSVRSFCDKHNANLGSKFENGMAEIRMVFSV